MPGTFSKVSNLLSNMGLRYVAFRAWHEVSRKSGLLQRRFPKTPPFKQYFSLDQWKQQPVQFLFPSRAEVQVTRQPSEQIQHALDLIQSGKLLMFNNVVTDLGKGYDWITNPDTGHRYDTSKHWTEIADLSREAGDIKYVWEKSRFSYLYDIIRYDHHFDMDCAEMVLSDILSWIAANPINCGPNYRCSQEMSLRVLNWLFALHYYKDSPILTEEVFDKIQHVIYWHLRHIYSNIQFSRIAVRNNHAITETLTLYLAGLLLPAYPDAAKWKRNGKKWFEEEIAYQVYDDGTYLQFSMNYHRVVVQLMTWGIALAEKNGEQLNEVVYDRARRSLVFLRTCMNDSNGHLPNYGANDGALFFKLSSANFRDYRPQLHALSSVLGMDCGIEGTYEDADWYHHKPTAVQTKTVNNGLHAFETGGYYVIRESDTLTFIRCGNHKDRPSQADNLHLDIWYKGQNLLADAGSYKYNTDADTLRYFSGTQSHNTVMLDDNDQMLKGGRFIWYYWTQRITATLHETNEDYVFSGGISAFRHVGKGIVHMRMVTKKKGSASWTIRDELVHMPSGKLRQLWHTGNKAHLPFSTLAATDKNGTSLVQTASPGWHSPVYGLRNAATDYRFSTETNVIETKIVV